MENLNLYFNSHKYPLTSHQLDRYRQFLRTHIPNSIKSSNPITMIKSESDDDGNESPFRVEVNIGYNDNNFIDRPTIMEGDKEKLLTPNDARLRNLTYETHIYADVRFDFFEDGSNTPIEFENKENIFKNIYVGSVPIMLHSDPCVLHGQNQHVLRAMKECVYDYGGYFILNGKEKVIISQERITKNRLFKVLIDDPNENFSHKAYISCIAEQGEGSLYPKRLEFFMYKNPTELLVHSDDAAATDISFEFDHLVDGLSNKNLKNIGAVVVRMTKIQIDIPIILLFRFLGLTTDEDIYRAIFGDMEDHSIDEKNMYSDFLRACMIHAHQLTKGKRDFDLIKYIVDHSSTMLKMDVVRGILYVDLFPNIESLKGKIAYLGYLTKQFAMFTMGFSKETDKDSYFYKRIDVSGIMLAELFNETYDRFKKEIRDTIDRTYYYGVWRSKRVKNADNRESYKMFMGSEDDVRRLIPAVFMSKTFVQSLKGRWGMAESDEYEEGKVQDLSRISYMGYLSHVRRVDINIDRSLKLFKSHMLHSH